MVARSNQYPSVQLPPKWPLVQTLDQRAAGSVQGLTVYQMKDARLINCLVEKVGDDHHVSKRFGIQTKFNTLLNQQGLGAYYWERNSAVHSIFGMLGGATKYYNNATYISDIPVLYNGKFYFVEIPAKSGTPLLRYIVFGNGAWTGFTTGSIAPTQIVDVDFPTNCVKGFAYLNDILYVMDVWGFIHGSDTGDITSWDPANVIRAQSAPDIGVALAKQDSYVVALKERTIEFFTDVGNPTGSALQRAEGARLNYGCYAADTVVDQDGKIFLVSQQTNKSPQVSYIENLRLTVISTPVIEKLLEPIAGQTLSAFGFRHSGHMLYVIQSSALNFSLVYDFSEKFWYYWTDVTGLLKWPVSAVTTGPVGVGHQAQGLLGGLAYDIKTSFDNPGDDGQAPNVEIFTPNTDFGVGSKKKQLQQMHFSADMVFGSTLQVRYSEDDYQTWSNFVNVNLGETLPVLTGLGSFYRRAFHLRHQSFTAFRLTCANIAMDIGT